MPNPHYSGGTVTGCMVGLAIKDTQSIIPLLRNNILMSIKRLQIKKYFILTLLLLSLREVFSGEALKTRGGWMLALQRTEGLPSPLGHRQTFRTRRFRSSYACRA